MAVWSSMLPAFCIYESIFWCLSNDRFICNRTGKIFASKILQARLESSQYWYLILQRKLYLIVVIFQKELCTLGITGHLLVCVGWCRLSLPLHPYSAMEYIHVMQLVQFVHSCGRHSILVQDSWASVCHTSSYAGLFLL